MSIPSHEKLCRALFPAMLAAGRKELEYFRGNFEVEHKADASPVTVADQEAEEILLRALSAVAPEVPVIAEEQYSAGIIPDVDGTLFLVDALDGTRAFVRGKSDFTVNVALIVDRIPVFGMILLPANGQFYATLAPKVAAFAMVDLHGDASFDATKFVPIQPRQPDPNALIVALSNSHPSKRLEQQLAGKSIVRRLEAGSSLKFCRVAEGKADFYPRIGSISEWDIAAGHAILRAAGGEVTRLDGGPLLYGNASEKFRTPPFVAWAEQGLKHHVRFSSAH